MSVNLDIPWERKCPRCSGFVMLGVQWVGDGPVIECPRCSYAIEDPDSVARMLASWKRCLKEERRRQRDKRADD